MAADPRVLHLRSRMAHVLRGLLALLRRMDDDADGETEKQIRALFDASPAAPELPAAPAAFELPRRQSRGDSRHSGATDDPDDVGFGRFRTSEPQPRPARAKEAASAPAPPAPDVVPAAPRLPTRHALVSVLDGTDWVPLAAQNGRPRYGDEGGESLSFGVATVSMPDRNTHIKGRLERPRWYRLEFRGNVQKHVVITALEAVDQEQFEERARLCARARDGSNDEALLFVDGFNVGFEKLDRRTAQFATDLEFGGVAIAYSWPSKGSLFAYHQDGDVSKSSMFRLAELIALLRSRLGRKACTSLRTVWGAACWHGHSISTC